MATMTRHLGDVDADVQEIARALEAMSGLDEVLIVAGLGGPWTSPTTRLIAKCLTDKGQRVHVFATLPFPFEGRERRKRAEQFAAGIGGSIATLYPLDLTVLVKSVPDNAPFSSVFDRVADQLFERYLRLASRQRA